MKQWQVLSTQIVHETPWLSLQQDRCRIGHEELTYTFVHKKIDGPLIVPEYEPGKLLMAQSYRHPVKKNLWQFPAEGRMPGESWEQAAQRGLQEEIGYTAHRLTLLLETIVDPGLLDQKAQIFLAQELEFTGKREQFEEEQGTFEEHETGLFSLEEIDTLIQEGLIQDHWTLSGLYLYQRFREKQNHEQ